MGLHPDAHPARCPTSTRGTAGSAVEWIERYDRTDPFFLFVGFPGPHDPWDAPAEAVERYRGVDISMPTSTRRPEVEGTGRYGALLEPFTWVSDSETMTDDAIRGMRHAYAADISVIDHAVGEMVGRAGAQGRCWTTRGSSTPATTVRWAATTA